jgi:septal ring factor EnvC (AmiA/AmiB activator)
MRIPTIYDEKAYLSRAREGFPVALLSVVAALAIIASLAIFFWPGYPLSTATPVIDPEVRVALQDIRAGQRQTTSGIKTISDSLTAERDSLKMLSDQISALTARLSALQYAATRILSENAELAEQLKVTQVQIAQDNALVAEQLKTLMQMARDNTSTVEQLKESHEQMVGIFAKVSEGSRRSHTPLPQPRSTTALPKQKPVGPSQARTQLQNR